MFDMGQCSPAWAPVCGIVLVGCGADAIQPLPDADSADAVEVDPLFMGAVVDEQDEPLEARIRINGVETYSSLDAGEFEMVVPVAATYLIDVHKRGYVPFSFKHSGHGLINFRVELGEAEVHSVDPAATIDVVDSRGTRIVIEPSALIDSEGNPPQGNLDLIMHTYDVRERPMPGNRDALDAGGNPVYL